MPNIKTGQSLPCIICGEMFYRRKSYIKRGIRKTCGKSECKSAGMSGPNNPFWGKTHDAEMMKRIAATKRARPGPRKKTGPPKGYRHSAEAREKMRVAVLERWRVNREKMLAALPRGAEHHFRKTNYEPRHRKNFSRVQRRDWKGQQCFYCKADDGLILDHIIPVMAGGTNEKRNAQTLCQPCNLWKMWFVDRPLYLAGLGSQRGQI